MINCPFILNKLENVSESRRSNVKGQRSDVRKRDAGSRKRKVFLFISAILGLRVLAAIPFFHNSKFLITRRIQYRIGERERFRCSQKKDHRYRKLFLYNNQFPDPKPMAKSSPGNHCHPNKSPIEKGSVSTSPVFK